MAILSIQSHVVFGYAGNSAAVFPLERLGHEVWAVNTVEFSNHTGYGAWRGKVLGGELAEELVAGLEDRDVLSQCKALLSGYMGDAAVGAAVMNALRLVRRAAPDALYCCDPVMGDVGRGFYVKPDIPAIFREQLVPDADIITPNQFELEALTGMKTAALEDARAAIDRIHAMGPKVVLVTSYQEEGGDSGTAAGGDRIAMLASDGSSLYRVHTPVFSFTQATAGSGDLTTALFLSRYLESRDIKRALELTAASIFGVIKATWEAGRRELALIAAQAELETPSSFFPAEKL
ncbi:MAG: pyridoxal kinase PdxY [Treponema sp.]|jgi:pyridoxine kinase|nr:pyridoxal kinase PdxY [Treponema sp.]